MADQMMDKYKTVLVKKASGEEEPFEKEKLIHSLRNAGAKNEVILKVVDDIENWIYSGVTTKKIYTRAFAILRRERTSAAIRYRLKQAIMELGPTGYPFEHLMGQIFRTQGFDTVVGTVIAGDCVSHEMDVVATNKNIQYLVECKYSKDQGKQVSIQVPLYVKSRVDDIIRKRKTLPEYEGLAFAGWVVTNARFSSDSIQYSKCRGLHLLAWDYPKGNGLKDIIEKLKIYPITVVHNLTKKEKQSLLNQGIVTSNQVLQNPTLLDDMQLSKKKSDAILKELNDICG